MTREDKQLLLRDLCGRVTYNTKVRVIGDWFYEEREPYDSILTFMIMKTFEENDNLSFIIKPYLRPVSSMKEKEIDTLFNILDIDKSGKDKDWIKINDALGIKFFFPTGKWIDFVADALDYLNSIHIDYLGLIEMELAIPAPEDMYDHAD